MNLSIAEILEKLDPSERKYVSSVLVDGEVPSLEGIWSLMDAAWEECRCDPDVIDKRIAQFYAHPVWLLNGMFIERHSDSLSYRRDFAEYVASLNPGRVADFGGGYGSLARMIGECCPNAEVHVVEPHPHATAVLMAGKTSNVRYVPELQGVYDVIIATDVFEHVPDPLALVARTATHLRIDGEYLMANCFWPVIRCHLPATFHFRWSWDMAMMAMNMRPGKAVAYGRAYKRVGSVSSDSARIIEQRSRRWFWFIERLPALVRGRFARFLVSGLR